MWIILTILIKICFCIFHFGEIKKIKPWIHSYYSMLMSILSPLFRWFSLNPFHFSPCYSLLLSQTNLSVFKWSSLFNLGCWLGHIHQVIILPRLILFSLTLFFLKCFPALILLDQICQFERESIFLELASPNSFRLENFMKDS